MPRQLLLGAILSASLMLGAAAPSYAQIAPSDAGISEDDWQLVTEIGELNNALLEYVDDNGEVTLVFTGGNVPDTWVYPDGFTGFSNSDIVLTGEYSQFATNDEVLSIKNDAIDQIKAGGYNAIAEYNADTDVVDVVTKAPASVTDSLVSTYDSKINIVAGDPGISEEDWALITEIGDLNNALTEYVDDNGEVTLVFTGGSVPDTWTYPDGFTGFSDSSIVLTGEYSQFASNDEVSSIESDAMTQIQDAGYGASAVYNPYTDAVDVTTSAPSSVTDSLVATYDSKINFIAGDVAASSGVVKDHAKKETAKEKAAKERAAKKKAAKERAAKKKAAKEKAAKEKAAKEKAAKEKAAKKAKAAKKNAAKKTAAKKTSKKVTKKAAKKVTKKTTTAHKAGTKFVIPLPNSK
ncbi:hypothetical protein [Streptomyces geranii]|uniref:hypothetical protein n=1 Tax=Streptomyces geranii TaxID=2058923 RepID=UPI0018E57421|nr:hypothetical protein [Streptomyces geranii]